MREISFRGNLSLGRWLGEGQWANNHARFPRIEMLNLMDCEPLVSPCAATGFRNKRLVPWTNGILFFGGLPFWAQFLMT